MNKYILIVVVLLVVGIGVFYFNKTDDQRLCECVSVGEVVNDLSASFFDRPYSVQGKDSLDQIIAFRDSICAPFIEMKTEDLHKAAKKCPQLEIEF
jgi:hypothetical protein